MKTTKLEKGYINNQIYDQRTRLYWRERKLTESEQKIRDDNMRQRYIN